MTRGHSARVVWLLLRLRIHEPRTGGPVFGASASDVAAVADSRGIPKTPACRGQRREVDQVGSAGLEQESAIIPAGILGSANHLAGAVHAVGLALPRAVEILPRQARQFVTNWEQPWQKSELVRRNQKRAPVIQPADALLRPADRAAYVVDIERLAYRAGAELI